MSLPPAVTLKLLFVSHWFKSPKVKRFILICGEASGEHGISVEMAWKLSKALGAAPNFWLNRQNNWELSRFETSTVAKINRLPDLVVNI